MQSLSTIIEEPLKLLGAYEVEIAIIGGVAATLYGSAQLTNDIDVCYARNRPNLEKLADALIQFTLTFEERLKIFLLSLTPRLCTMA